MEYKVVMPYLGGILSENAYKMATRRTKPFVKRWMRELAEKVQDLNVPESENYEVRLFGKFTDERRPDLSNLHKVIGDALEKGLGTNDKHFLFKDEGYDLGHMDPELEITIVPVVKRCNTMAIQLGKLYGRLAGPLQAQFHLRDSSEFVEGEGYEELLGEG